MVLCAAAAAATASWAQKAAWHPRASQAELLAGQVDSSATPAAAMGVIVSAAVCLLVAAWILPPPWRRFIAAAAVLGACATLASVTAYLGSHRAPVATTAAALAAAVLVLVAGGVMWRRRDAHAPTTSRYERSAGEATVRASRESGGESAGPTREAASPASAANDPWKALDAGIDPTL